MFGVGLAISIPLIAVAFAVDNLGLLIARTLQSLIFWKNHEPQAVTQQRVAMRSGDSDDEGLKPVYSGRSEEIYRGRLSFDIERETRPIRRSIYSKDRSWRDGSVLRNGIRPSADLERGQLGSG